MAQKFCVNIGKSDQISLYIYELQKKTEKDYSAFSVIYFPLIKLNKCLYLVTHVKRMIYTILFTTIMTSGLYLISCFKNHF